MKYRRTPNEGWASFRDAHLAAPDEATATRMGLTDQRAYVRSLEARLREAHCWHSRSLSPPRGQGSSPAPDTQKAKKTKIGQGAASAPASGPRQPDQGPGRATPHHPTPRRPGHTNSTAPTSAQRHHRTAAAKPCSPVSHHRPHTSTPCQDPGTCRARGHGTTNTTTTPPSLPAPAP